jgi:hypothetical protein
MATKTSKKESKKITKVVKANKIKDDSNNTNKNSKIAKIHNLEGIKKDYELGGEKEHITLGLIKHKLSETLEAYLEIIQQMLQPEEFHALYESNAFDDNDKQELLQLYKRIIIIHRELLKAHILSDEEKSIATINTAYKDICNIKPKIVDIVDKMQKSWTADSQTNKHKSTQYFG